MTPSEMSNADLDRLTLARDRLGPGLKRTNTNELMAQTFAPLMAAVPGYIYAGLNILAGRQKLGKTWLGIDFAIAVATGGVAMGSIDCASGDVLYVDLENGPRRIQARIKALFPYDAELPDMARLEWATEAPRLDAGLIDRLEIWRLTARDPRFVVIDVLQRIKPPGNRHQNAYESDYSTWAPLQNWAITNGVAVLGLHHTKKGGAEDPLEALSGSNGLAACADTVLVLDQDQNGRTLYVRGRDVEERETAVKFVAGSWSIIGEAAEVRRSDERSYIIAAMRDHGEPMTPSEIASATARPNNNVRVLLFKMAKAGDVYKVGGGRYWVEPIEPVNTGNSGNATSENPENTEVSEHEGITSYTSPGNACPEIGTISNRHKCAHCGKRGGTTFRQHDKSCRNWLHDGCADAWTEGYRERTAAFFG